ncbi:MAG: HAD family phosphatase [Clostridia bacterium]|nr:HAD family phosphatase [Clostridia bacterium]
MTDFKCAIFDLDGTVLDSADVWNQIDIEFFAQRGMAMPEDYGKIISPMGFQRAAEYTVATYGLSETPQEVVAVWNKMSREKFKNEVKLKPGAKEYLEHLKSRGVVLCIATASQEDMFIPALENNGIYHLFDYITTLNEVKRGKGFPDIYLKASQKAGFEVKDCVVFEDLLAGIKGAKDGGFYTVAMYDKNSKKDIEKIKNITDKLIYSFEELI